MNTAHLTAELLSAYLDHQLPETEVQQVEDHLQDCDQCRLHLNGMRRVVSQLGHLERMAPPPTLDQVVARRISLEGAQESLLDRLERGISSFPRQSSMLAMFCLVISLVVIAFLFLNSLQEVQSRRLPVVFEEGSEVRETTMAVGSQITVHDRTFTWFGDRWVEVGIEPDSAAEPTTWDSVTGLKVLKDLPQLSDLRDEAPVVMVVEGEILELSGFSEPSAPTTTSQ